MELSRFRILIDNFEKNIVVESVIQKRFSRMAVVATKNCKLSNYDFGKRIGDVIDTEIVLVIDYYGYLKRSKGFLEKMRSKVNPLPKELRSYMVHFASIKMEDIAAMTSDISVMLDFPRLKNEILILRGFKKSG